MGRAKEQVVGLARRAAQMAGRSPVEREGPEQVISVPAVPAHGRHGVPAFCANSVYTTKYTGLSFLPRFLWHQFSQAANLFFLVIALLQQIEGVSPTSRWSTVVPLLFILGVSAVKELLEDRVCLGGVWPGAEACVCVEAKARGQAGEREPDARAGPAGGGGGR